MKILASLLLVLTSLCGIAQKKPAPLLLPEDKLALYQDSLMQLEPKVFKAKTDQERFEANKKFIEVFERVLQYHNSFEFPFDSLKGVARLASSDNKFRIINWNVPHDDGTHEYFGFVQVFIKKTKSYKVFRLNDQSAEIKNPDNTVGTPDKWYGMLYYKLIETRHKKKTYYTLLGWDGNDKISRKKVVDVISFAADGSPRFGDAIFAYDKKYPKRVIFEYANDAVMTLTYSEARKEIEDEKPITGMMIVFSHLVPTHPALQGQYQFYVNEGSLNGFRFVKGKWEYVADIDARNPKSKNDALEGKSVKGKPVYVPK